MEAIKNISTADSSVFQPLPTLEDLVQKGENLLNAAKNYWENEEVKDIELLLPIDDKWETAFNEFKAALEAAKPLILNSNKH